MKINNFRRYIFILLISIVNHAYSQESIPGPVIICPGMDKDMHTQVMLPVNSQVDTVSARLAATATFQVTYDGFPAQAQLAFQHAINIWESLISSPVPIRIQATWQALETNTLASAGTTLLYRNFAGALRADVWYPVALAESLSGTELNGTTETDINVVVNSNVNWYLGRDGNTLSGNYDLVTIVLHEIGHGLGIFSSTDVMTNTGSWGLDGFPFIYDLFLENREGERLTDTEVFPNPSAQLQAQFTGNNLFFNGPFIAQNLTSKPRVFAPAIFEAGSSIAHLDEFAYPAGNPNSLMTPLIGRAESVQTPGEIVLSILADLGWETTIPGAEPVVLQVFPNPTSDVLTISARFTNTTGQVAILVVNALGQEIIYNTYSRRTRTFSDQINVAAVPAGIYYVQVKDGSETSTKRILVKR